MRKVFLVLSLVLVSAFALQLASSAQAPQGQGPAPVAGAWEITPMQGGLPILKDGKAVAAIGVGGSAPANDEAFAQAGLDAVTPK